MKAIMVMFDSLNRHMLEPYGCDWTLTPNFIRLSERTVTFDNCYAGSLPCMPARRELHTGRYNFLHRSWGPIEPFDDSMPEILKDNGIYTHLVSDHTHYWEDGGATYHTRYSSWENFRGQEGDPWKGVVDKPVIEENLIEFSGHRKKLFIQDMINRKYLMEEKVHPQAMTFEAGMEFMRANRASDNWFLQIETFDPHEPYFSYSKYKELYKHDYEGPKFDWPDYAPVTQTAEQVSHCRCEYAALLSMCDSYLGKILDVMDKYNMWEDTMLIVNTDHGFLLGEHGYWAKNYMPLYNEIVRTPLFIWHPQIKACGERRSSLVQTIDLTATLYDYFGVNMPESVEGKSLAPVIKDDTSVRKAGLFGIHGGHVCCTDGRYVYMRASVKPDNQPLYNYTLMPTHMAERFSIDEIKTMEKEASFTFTKGCPVMKIRTNRGNGSYKYGNLLFDIEKDPEQENPIKDEKIELYMLKLMVELMLQNDCPTEQFERLGIECNVLELGDGNISV